MLCVYLSALVANSFEVAFHAFWPLKSTIGEGSISVFDRVDLLASWFQYLSSLVHRKDQMEQVRVVIMDWASDSISVMITRIKSGS